MPSDAANGAGNIVESAPLSTMPGVVSRFSGPWMTSGTAGFKGPPNRARYSNVLEEAGSGLFPGDLEDLDLIAVDRLQ